MLEQHGSSSSSLGELVAQASPATSIEPVPLNVASIRAIIEQPAAESSISLGSDSPSLVIDPYLRDRSDIKVGIIAIGANSGFHRSLVASLAHDAIKGGDKESGICAVSLKNGVNDLRAQDGLFILNSSSYSNSHYEVIGSIVEVAALADRNDRDLVMSRFVDQSVRFVTTVITPAGYYLDSDGFLDTGAEEIKWDLAHLNEPKTAIGLLVHGLHERYLAHRNEHCPITIIPCDNFPPIRDVERGQFRGLGECLKTALIDYAATARLEPDFQRWIHDFVGVPNTQVDRITSYPSAEVISEIQNEFGLTDRCTVATEPRPESGLVVEWRDPTDSMSMRYVDRHNPPKWLAQPGVVLAEDAKAWCEMKTYTLNLSHVVLAWLAKYLGRQDDQVHTFLEWPGVKKFLVDTLLKCVGPSIEMPHHLREQSVTPYEDYVAATLRRLGNDSLPDSLSRLDTDGTRKMRTRIMPVVIRTEERARQSGAFNPVEKAADPALAELARLALVVAVWAKCVTMEADQDGKAARVDNKDSSAYKWKSDLYGRLTDIDAIQQFLRKEEIFGETPDRLPYFALYFKTILLCKLDVGRPSAMRLEDLLAMLERGSGLHDLLAPHFDDIWTLSGNQRDRDHGGAPIH